MGRNSHVCGLPCDSSACMQPSVRVINLWPWSFSTQKLWLCVMHGKITACNMNMFKQI